MTIKLSTLLLPALKHQLQAMSAQLEKGVAASSDEGAALLEARLAPDMFPLAAQIKTSCGQSTDAIARLMGQPNSATPDVTDMASARTLIADTLAGLAKADAEAIDAAADQTVSLDLPNGMAFDMSGQDFVRDWVLPQLHFHTAMAYAILRNQGVEIGKIDLLPYMMAHARRPA